MSTYIDNRDASEMNRYMEARIEALQRRLAEKDLEIQKLHAQVTECHRQALAREQAIAELLKGRRV